ncbi:Rep [uncultured virus]|uniref:Rep n=1 Tax=uncultured virus TaxID=340016 RepID=A0A2K9LS62_9VIRU|nr:Rep [uncultured virus]
MSEEEYKRSIVKFGRDPEEGEKFQIQNQRMILTYTGKHFIKKEYIAWLSLAFPKHEIKFVRCAHETCPTTKNPHTHVGIDFGKRAQITNVRKLDYDGIHPNIRCCSGAAHWSNILNYLGKEDPENEDLQKGRTARKIWACSNVQDALQVMDPESATAALVLWNNRPENKIEIDEPDKEWHREFFQMVTPSNRKVDWIFDKKGNTGKSWLCKWLMFREEKDWYVVKGMKSAKDFATIMEAAIGHWGKNRGNLAFDLPRSNEEYDSIYTCLEMARDGMVTTSKYMGKTIGFRIDRVVVFANFGPKMKKMSMDRWRLWEISGENLIRWAEKLFEEIEQSVEV